MNLDYHRKSLACLSLLSSLCSFVSSFPFVILHQLPYPKGKKIVCQRYPYLQVAIDFKRKHSWMNLDYHRRSMAWLNSFHLHHISYPKGKKIGYQRYPYSQVTVNFQKKHPHVWIWTTTEGVWLGFLFRPYYAASSLSLPFVIPFTPPYISKGQDNWPPQVLIFVSCCKMKKHSFMNLDYHWRSMAYTANAYRQTTDKLMFKSVISTVRWIRK